MRNLNRRNKGLLAAAAVILAAAIGFFFWFKSGTSSLPEGQAVYIRYNHPRPLLEVLEYLETQGVVKNARASQLLAWWQKRHRRVPVGTFLVRPGMPIDEVLNSLSTPVKQMVRMPSQNWAMRSANWLEMHQVTTAEEYLALVNEPATFKGTVTFPIEGDSLEGYLFPDTYDFPPLLGAKEVVDRQLKAFEKRVWEPLHHPRFLGRALIVASLVELEVARDDERPLVAGVIENRLAQDMPLQIDATVLYAKQKWGRLAIKELTSVKSPFNTYLHKGLPPGPICSPSIKSIEAALHPAKHDFLYYVAMPDGHQIFAKTMEEHLHNIALRKAALKQTAKVSP